MRQISWVAAVLFLFSSLCYPQDATPTDPDTIRQMVQQVKDLQERVRILESPQSHAGVSTPTSPNLPIPLVELAEELRQLPTAHRNSTKVHGIQGQGSESSITRS
jgi:hypothetical protein